LNGAVQVGDVLTVKEPDYMYGTGVLILRVTRVGRVQQLKGGPWLDLAAWRIRHHRVAGICRRVSAGIS
jgi:hypothetical protein